MTWPLTHSAASVQRNPTTGAMSPGSPSLSIGLFSTLRRTISSLLPAKNMSVAVGPGATQLAVMRVPLSSLAIVRTSASTAALDAVYAPYPGGRLPTTDDVTATIRPPPPPPPRGRRFAASRRHRNAPRRFTASTRSKDSVAVPATVGYASSSTPALATRMCAPAPPNADRAASKSDRAPASSETSARTATARGSDAASASASSARDA
ncbi:uncharacterized protein LOC120659437 [Panicum virgatum]|uniref:uncharacterized protein LOC120659437 n=1 Tax=Panicum virgatum TaxID=38727 RepID=UPI0019D5D34E|nr:uncharacterized protein LOC120659437 [Panicum virgatum]